LRGGDLRHVNRFYFVEQASNPLRICAAARRFS
jgi:hypothetical protein